MLPSCERVVIGSRHGEKKFETLIGVEEMARATDMGPYWRVAPDNRTLHTTPSTAGAP